MKLFQKRASEKNLGIETPSSLETSPTPTGVTGRTSPEGVEFDKIAASRSTPQPKPKASLMDDLEGLDTQWGSNNPWGSSSFGAEGGGATTTSFNPFQPNPNPSNPWGSSTTGMQVMYVGVWVKYVGVWVMYVGVQVGCVRGFVGVGVGGCVLVVLLLN